MSEPWPLSAAATAVLRDPRSSEVLVLRLALRELVLRRAWRIEHRERSGLLRRSSAVHLMPGASEPPDLAPLPELHAALEAAVGPDGRRLDRTVGALRSTWGGVSGDLRRETRADLIGRGFLLDTRKRLLGVLPRAVLVPTPEGAAMLEASFAREDGLRVRFARNEPALGAEVAAAGGLVLLADPQLAGELEAYFARRAADGGSGGGGGGEPSADGMHDLSFLDATSPAFDASFDSGGGGGGDGGGGDGGGG